MHTKPTRQGLTAATTAGRALLAAGWRYDSTTPMANDTTIRTLLHPSGREIHARTVDGGEQTALTMTGLTLEQAAGAITGAGLAPAGPTTTPAEPDARRIAYDLVVAGVAAGLPIPDGIDIPSDNTIFGLKMRDNDRESVDAWAAYLNLPKAELGEIVRASRDFRNYEAGTWDCPAMPGWRVEVGSYIDEPKPEDAEKAALAARVAELEAQLAEDVTR